ncbi:MAG: hypothetical protein WDA23_05995 [Gemmobacter sp.]
MTVQASAPLAIPLAGIRDDALPRDRLTLDEAALGPLTVSILAEGLRQPIELFPVADPGDPDGPPYGLISGLRRLTVFRRLAARNPEGPHATIPAFLRAPESITAAMVSENEMRAPVTPWEKGALIRNT